MTSMSAELITAANYKVTVYLMRPTVCRHLPKPENGKIPLNVVFPAVILHRIERPLTNAGRSASNQERLEVIPFTRRSPNAINKLAMCGNSA